VAEPFERGYSALQGVYLARSRQGARSVPPPLPRRTTGGTACRPDRQAARPFDRLRWQAPLARRPCSSNSSLSSCSWASRSRLASSGECRIDEWSSLAAGSGRLWKRRAIINPMPNWKRA